jgi:RNA polymerase sigma-70 factor (ECF subfamily)
MENASNTRLPALSRSGDVLRPIKDMTEEKPSIREIFDSEESALLRFAYGICGQRETAEDIVQEAFLRLHEHWDEVQNPLAWLYRSIRNLALNHIRDHRKESPMQDGEEWQSESPMASEVLGKMEAVGVLRMLMADMHDEDRNIIDLKYHRQMSYEDISKRTGLTVSNVGYKLHHLLKNLADSLRRMGVEGAEG